MKQINIAIVGCGWISERHTEAYQWMYENGLKYFHISSLCDISEEKANRLAEKISSFQNEKPRIYNELGIMLEKELELDAVDVCTHRHDFVAIPSLLYGSEGCIDFDARKIWSEGKEFELSDMQNEMMASLDEESKEWLFPKGSTNQFVIELAVLGVGCFPMESQSLMALKV